MKILEQLAEDKFVVQMEDYDLRKEKSLTVAHDYVQFGGRHSIITQPNTTISGKFVGLGSSNVLRHYVDIQIPIRDMVTFVLPYLNSHKYCQPEHLVSDGKPRYCFDSGVTFFVAEDGTQMAAVRLEGEEKHSIMSREVYEALKSGKV